MKITHFKQIKTIKIEEANVKGVEKRVLISAQDGAPNFTMRMFTVEPGGYTFHHAHNFEHEIYVLAGSGEVLTEQGPVTFEKDSALLISPNEQHQIRNTGPSPLSFLCLVPNENEK